METEPKRYPHAEAMQVAERLLKLGRCLLHKAANSPMKLCDRLGQWTLGLARRVRRACSPQRMVRRMWWGLVKRDCWKCAHRLIWLGQDNGAAQEHIDAAKDALYRAANAADAEGSGVDAPNNKVSDGS